MINLGPRLYLEIVDSPSLTPGTKYEIDMFGLKESARTNKDGHVYVGSLEKNESNAVANDIVLSLEKDSSIEGRHFVI